ncbi:hypothetical protein KAU39_08110, partial [bacterium]|nr:hypothetical protein [bacterium]
CQNANLHGFYFKGFVGSPVFDYENVYAVDKQGNRYPLEIKKLSSKKYDIILAGGKAFDNGEITYFFRYANDLQMSGNVTQTDSEFGRLAVFNWAPVQWDEGFQHETVTIHYPIVLPAESVSEEDLKRIKFLTEKYVNKRYLIDYTTVKGRAGENIFTVKFHRENLTPRYHFQIQTYLNAALFELTTIAGKMPWAKTDLKKAREVYFLNRLFPGSVLAQLPMSLTAFLLIGLVVIVVFIIVPFFIMTRKHQSMLVAQAGISKVKWDGDEWVPPKIQVGSFRKKGKIYKDLSALEAGLLLDIPLSVLLGMIIENMERKKLIKIESLDPIRLKRVSEVSISEDPYEDMIFHAIDTDGSIPQKPVYDMFYLIATGMEQKVWDCDLEATKEYYKKHLNKILKEKRKDAFYWYGYDDYYYGNRYHRYNYTRSRRLGKGLEGNIAQVSKSFSTFRTSPMCYDGPFVQNVCHDACHSACHSACHGACHGACVSSGH